MSSRSPSPSRLQADLQAALVRHRAGDLAAAETAYRRLLATVPGHGNAWNLLGVLLHQTGRRPQAAEALARATELLPGFADAHSNRAMVALDGGDFALAGESIARALALAPAHPSANALRIRLLQARGRAQFAQGSAASYAGALTDFAEARRYDPTNPELALALANTLRRLDRLPEALPVYREAVSLAPGGAVARVALATALREAEQWLAALDAFREAAAIDPACADAWQGIGVVLMEIGRADEAIPALQRAVDLAAASLAGSAAAFHSALLGALHYGARVSAETLREAHLAWAERHAPPRDPRALGAVAAVDVATAADQVGAAEGVGAAPACGPAVASGSWPRPSPAALAARRPPWRIGFLSADLRAHPVACFLISWLPHLRAGAAELFAYSAAPVEDATSATLRRFMSVWRRVSDLSDAQLAAAIAGDDLDLLLDLSGHTAPNRLPALAGKPARRLWHWIGYPASPGMSQFDGRVSDRIADPGDDSDSDFVAAAAGDSASAPAVHAADAGSASERLIRLPGCFLCYAPPVAASDLQPGDSRGARAPGTSGDFVFGSFNNLAKLNDDVVAVWSAILRAVPASRLRLKSRVLGDPSVAADLRRRFDAHGVATARLELQGFASSIGAHFVAYDVLDLALDPFPYNGTTTTCDALWMGVPVLTLRGSRHAGRVGASLIAAALGDVGACWVADDADDYVARAVAAASRGRMTLGERMARARQVRASPLTDGARFAAQLETVWQDHLGVPNWQARNHEHG